MRYMCRRVILIWHIPSLICTYTASLIPSAGLMLEDVRRVMEKESLDDVEFAMVDKFMSVCKAMILMCADLTKPDQT